MKGNPQFQLTARERKMVRKHRKMYAQRRLTYVAVLLAAAASAVALVVTIALTCRHSIEYDTTPIDVFRPAIAADGHTLDWGRPLATLGLFLVAVFSANLLLSLTLLIVLRGKMAFIKLQLKLADRLFQLGEIPQAADHSSGR